MDVLHKKFDDRRRHRQGYSEAMGQTLHRSASVMEFLHSSEPVGLACVCVCVCVYVGSCLCVCMSVCLYVCVSV